MAGSGEALALHVLLCCLCAAKQPPLPCPPAEHPPGAAVGAGVATVKCFGHVWIEPAPVVPMGSNISINCRSTLGCPGATFRILLNYSQHEGPLHPLNSSTVQLRLHDVQVPYRTVTCFARCPNSQNDRLVCGTDLLAGYPPDPPGNLSCSIREHSGVLACTWDAGRPTQLNTCYSLHLRSVGAAAAGDAEDAEDAEDAVFPAGSPVLLSELRGGNHYLAWVQANNMLGAARSAPRHLNLQELVVPALPLVVGAQTMDASPPITTVRWRRQTLLENVRCEERHKATDAPAWRVEAWDDAAQPEPLLRHNLQSYTQYVFQVRCRLSRPNGPWSAWSTPFLYSTPEAAPALAPDVWRRLGPALPNGSREVTVLIKPLSARDARGRILGYAVVSESPGGPRLLCNTSSTACSLLLPPGPRTLRVTAHNARGASSPANITLGQGTSSQEEFPAPVAVAVKPQNRSGVSVSWQPPWRSRTPPLWFIVEWVSTSRYNRDEQYFWKKVPSQETHTDIPEEELAGGHINVSVYAVYPNGVSKPSSSQVPTEEPLLGSTSSHASHDDDIGVFLGLGASMVVLSVVLVILMFKKSARKRINATVVSLLPKWLFEDFPHVENSNAVKSLQEKSDLMSHSFHEPLLGTSDPTITEIEEVPAHEEYKNVASRRKPIREAPKGGHHPRSTALASITSPEPTSDYKPQVSDGNLLGYVAANFYQTQPLAALPEPEMSIFFRDYTSPAPQLWDGEGGEHQVCLLEKINLILNSSRSGQSQALGSAPGGQGSLLGTQWGHTLASDVQEQTLVPDELVSCLRAMNKESVDIQPGFPQSVGRLF